MNDWELIEITCSPILQILDQFSQIDLVEDTDIHYLCCIIRFQLRTWTWRLDLLSTGNWPLDWSKHKTGLPSESTANLTPIPSGQPSGSNIERVPLEDKSIIVLETSAGKGLKVEDSTGVLTDAVEMAEHLMGFKEVLIRKWEFGGMNLVVAMGCDVEKKVAEVRGRFWSSILEEQEKFRWLSSNGL